MCYVVPIAGAVVTTILHRKKKGIKLWWLNLMFYGGALFGIVDHLWHGELFFISENWAADLFLGVVISAVILVVWCGILVLTKVSPTLSSYVMDKK